MCKNLIIIFLLLIIHSNCDYVTFDGSKLISLSYSPNEDYDATENVSIENFSQEMISYYSWFVSYGNCYEADIPLLCCKEHADFFTNKWTVVSEAGIENYFKFNFVLFRNDEYKKYIIAFPSTRDPILELLTEVVNIKLVNFDDFDNGIKVVSYFYKVTQEIKDVIFTPEVFIRY